MFMALRQKFGQTSWNTWADEYKNRYRATLNDVRFALKFSMMSIKFEQYIFFKQWVALKNYANERGILLLVIFQFLCLTIVWMFGQIGMSLN